MNIFEALFGAAVAAAVIPYKVVVKEANEEENTPKTVTVESLTYRVEVTSGEGTANITVPAPGIKKIVSFFKEKGGVVKAKAGEAKEKVVVAKGKVAEKVSAARAKRAAKKAAAAAEEPEVITIEIPVTDDTVAEA